MSDSDEVAKFEQLAEASYSAMYDARPHNVKDCHDDAQLYYQQAMEAARRSGLAGDVARLIERSKHVEDVYNSQFRGIGR
jgi:hypothetical protein